MYHATFRLMTVSQVSSTIFCPSVFLFGPIYGKRSLSRRKPTALCFLSPSSQTRLDYKPSSWVSFTSDILSSSNPHLVQYHLHHSLYEPHVTLFNLHNPSRIPSPMNTNQSNKPFRVKNISKHVLANIVLSVVVCYLILGVEQLRAGNCSTRLAEPNPNGTSHQQVPIPPQQQNLSQQLSVDQLKIKRLDAIARRTRPQPPCVDGTQAKSFLIIFMGHSGSSAITSELKGHPQVHVELAELVDHQEVFNTTEALQATREFFDRGIALGKTPGYKIRPMHISKEPEKWRELADTYGTRIIWQYRQNLFKGAIGEYANRYLNDTSVVEGLRKQVTREERCKIGAGCSYPIKDITFLHRLLRNMIRSQQSIVRAVQEMSKDRKFCVRELPYEDYLYEREASLADIFKFLGLRQEVTKPLRYKATDDNLCKVVENWQETCNAFYGCTLLQHMVDDPRNNCFCNLRMGATQQCPL